MKTVKLFALIHNDNIVVSHADAKAFLKRIGEWADYPVEEFINEMIGVGEYVDYKLMMVEFRDLSDSDKFIISNAVIDLVEEFSEE